MRSKLRTILLCVALQMGVFAGVPMRPEEIEELLRSVNQPKIAHTIPETSDDDEPNWRG